MADRPNTVRRHPVKPADAAGLILIRSAKSGQPEILIGRRPSRMGFLPGIHVMPGGRVDPPDELPSGFPGGPHPAIAVALRGKRPPIAFLNAALRETYEETGLLAGRPYRSAADHPTAFWQAYQAAGLAPDYAGLDYLCRAITPVISKRRFNTRFFLGDGNHIAGTLAGNGELEDLGWRKVNELADLTLVDVTQYALETALRRWKARTEIGAEAPKLLNYRKDIMTLSNQRQGRG